MGDVDVVDVVVVGAGHAGLAASWHLQRRGVTHLVLEAGRIGESWRSQRWDSFTLNTPTWANRMPGDDPAADAEPPDGFLAVAAWVARLEAYVARFGLPVQTGVRVTGLDASARRLRLRTSAPDHAELAPRAVIVASGFQRVARLSQAAASVPAGVLSLHTVDYRRPDALPPGGVLIVGSAQSGGQIAEELLAAGRHVVVAASAVPRVPRRYRGRDIVEWLRGAGFFDHTVAALPDPRMRFVPPPMISGLGRYGHTISLQGLAARGAQLTGRLLGFEDGVACFADDLTSSLRFGDRASTDARAAVDRAIADNGIPAPAAEPDPDDVPVADPEAWHGPARLDLAAEGIGTLIWATGFGPDTGWLSGAVGGAGPGRAGPGGARRPARRVDDGPAVAADPRFGVRAGGGRGRGGRRERGGRVPWLIRARAPCPEQHGQGPAARHVARRPAPPGPCHSGHIGDGSRLTPALGLGQWTIR